MKTVSFGATGLKASTLGFGCSGMLGRVGRKDSLAALTAAFDAGITFFDTARSYGYGESESLLGEFLQGRRSSVLIATKFGILPTPNNLLKRSLKPIARQLLQLSPKARNAIKSRLAAQSSTGHFTVRALHESLEASLRALRTEYVDLLFLHEAPVDVLQQDNLFAALQQLVIDGKIRGFGIASGRPVIEAAIDSNLAGLHSVQFPCNLFDLGAARTLPKSGGSLIAIANHPFGGHQGVTAGKALLAAMAQDLVAHDAQIPASLPEKLRAIDDAVLADAVLNLITQETGVHIVVPSMLRLDHLRANIAAIEHSRFSHEELTWMRAAIIAKQQATHRA